ncbi:DUF2125 domain-containing protein [Shimia isoporae]|nr:DUF2125 domain-containing protein [Shimia isoporae]
MTSPAYAEITAMDVWENMRTTASVFGGNLAARLEESDDGLNASIVTYRLSLTAPTSNNGQPPAHLADIEIMLPDMSLKETSQGTVQLNYDLSAPYVFTVSLSEGETFAVSTSLSASNGTMAATGTPEKITYDYAAERFQINVGPFQIPDEDDVFEMKMSFGYENLLGQSLIDTSNGLKISSSSRNSLNTFTSEDREPSEDGSIKITSTKGTSRGVTASSELSLPSGEINLFNLARALRSGLQISARMAADHYDETENTTLSGPNSRLIAHRETSLGGQDLSFTLDQKGIDLSLAARDVDVDATLPSLALFLIGTFEISAKHLDFRLALPLLKSDEVTDSFRLLLGLDEVELGENTWSAFDHSGTLPREPGNLKLDISSTTKSNIEWLDFWELDSALDATPGAYVQPYDLKIDTLLLEALGTIASATGAITFDHSDYETMEGMPLPEGDITVDIQGVQALLDALVETELLPTDQAAGVRLLLGGFSKSIGEDHLTSTIEMTAEGHILANGQRLK